MERLKIVLLTAAIVAVSQASKAQQSQLATPQQAATAMSPSYTVIGDIRDPRTVAIPSQGRLTIRAAVLQAQPAGDPVSVAVLRKTQERALWTQLISNDSADSGELVIAGDVLVVQAVSGAKEAVQKNAAIRTESGVLVVLLEDEAVAIGDILQQTVGLPTAEQLVTIGCRFQGRPSISKAALTNVVAHGDVIQVGRADRKILNGFGSMSPSFSEWVDNSESVTVMQPPAPSEISFPEPDTAAQSPSLALPVEFSALSEPAEPIEEIPGPGDAASDVDDPSAVAVQEASQAAVSDATNVSEVAPVPPAEQVAVPGEVVASNGLNIWNMAVIAGLIVAGILLLAGSLGAEDDMDVIHKPPMAKQTTQANRPASEKFQVNSHQTNTAPTEARSTLNSPPPLPVTVASDKNESVNLPNISIAKAGALPSDSLVKPGEWFGSDWRNKTTSAVVPSTVNELDATKANDSKAIETRSEVVASIADTTTPRPMRSSKIDEAEADRLENLVRSVANEARKTDSEKPQTVVSSSTEFSDLEDLLQNRLPVDLCEAQLPLRISLFGRPAGPRRMRIDAAHPTLSGPHTHLNADRRQDDRLPATASKSESRRIDAMSDDEGLDRALNSLQDRTNS